MATIRAPSGISLRAQPVRVAVPGEALVVVEDDRHGVLERRRLLEDDLADARVLDDGPPLGRRERRRLVEDRLGHRDLADVVEQRRDADPVDLGVGQLELAGHLDDDRGDERRRLAAVVGERGDERGQHVGRGLARLAADLHGPRPAGVRDRRPRDAGVLVGLLEDVGLVAAERLGRVHRRVGVADERLHPELLARRRRRSRSRSSPTAPALPSIAEALALDELAQLLAQRRRLPRRRSRSGSA